MDRLTEKGFNFTSDYVASNLQSYPISEALKKLQQYEDAEENGDIIRCEKCECFGGIESTTVSYGDGTPIVTYYYCNLCGHKW